MKCQAAKEMFSEYIEDELISEQRSIVDRHLQECAACKDEMEELLTVRELFASAERFSAPVGFSTRVMANLPETEESLWSRLFARPVLVKAMEIVFAVIIVIIGLISGNMLAVQKPTGVTSVEVRQSFALDTFEATPAGSIGGVYVSMTGVR